MCTVSLTSSQVNIRRVCTELIASPRSYPVRVCSLARPPCSNTEEPAASACAPPRASRRLGSLSRAWSLVLVARPPGIDRARARPRDATVLQLPEPLRLSRSGDGGVGQVTASMQGGHARAPSAPAVHTVQNKPQRPAAALTRSAAAMGAPLHTGTIRAGVRAPGRPPARCSVGWRPVLPSVTMTGRLTGSTNAHSQQWVRGHVSGSLLINRQ